MQFKEMTCDVMANTVARRSLATSQWTNTRRICVYIITSHIVSVTE